MLKRFRCCGAAANYICIIRWDSLRTLETPKIAMEKRRSKENSK
jgi:hypothetical protein